MRQLLTILSVMTFAVFGAGCETEPDSPGEAIEEAGDEIGDAVEEAGDELEDATN